MLRISQEKVDDIVQEAFTKGKVSSFMFIKEKIDSGAVTTIAELLFNLEGAAEAVMRERGWTQRDLDGTYFDLSKYEE